MAVPLSGKARVAISARGRHPFRGVEPMHVAATNGRAAFSAGDLNFAARSLALKKKGKKKKKKEAEKGSGTKEQGERQSVQSAPHSRPSASRLRQACVHPRDPLPGAGRTSSSEAFRGVGSSWVAAALGAGQPLALPPPLPPCDLKARIFKCCSARRQARRGGSGLFPQTSIGGFPRPPRHAARRVSRRGLRSSQVPAGAPGEGALHSPCCEGPGLWLRPLDHP